MDDENMNPVTPSSDDDMDMNEGAAAQTPTEESSEEM
jgi:hypothetical protein